MADNDNPGAAQTQLIAVAATSAGETGNTHFKLQGFWPENLGLWFAQVEYILANRNVTREFNRYCLVVNALPYDSLRLVAKLVEQVPAVDPYTVLKGRLLISSQISRERRLCLTCMLLAVGSCTS
jgi:hypothetical protein